MTQYQLSPLGTHVTRDGDTTISLLDTQEFPNTNEEYLAYRAWLDAGGVPLSEDSPSAAEVVEALRQALAVEYDKHMQIIAAGYPPSERESWPVQTQEARVLVADPAAPTPWIDAAALARGLDRVELAERICAKDDAYRQIHGALTGTRQRIGDAIDAAGDDAAALALIDVRVGWPASPE